MILKKEHFEIVIIAVLVNIFEKHQNDFPNRFDVFAKEITNQIYRRFKYIESNSIEFEREMQLLTGFEASNLIELAE
jgi:hypothetical protein